MKPTTPKNQEMEFLHALEDRLAPHLSDPCLTVRKILRIVFMSRSNLHRKLKEEAGMSASAYIRYVRLSRAKQLLEEEPRLPVSDVAKKVGFGSQSYFAKKFKELFGCCPKEVKGN